MVPCAPSVTALLASNVPPAPGEKVLVGVTKLGSMRPVLTDNPAEVGADRIVNCVAAFERFGGPTIVVDMGTATTFDVVSKKGEYLGGAIAPGLGVSADALFAKAAREIRKDFPNAEFHLVGPFDPSPNVLGKVRFIHEILHPDATRARNPRSTSKRAPAQARGSSSKRKSR